MPKTGNGIKTLKRNHLVQKIHAIAELSPFMAWRGQTVKRNALEER